MSIRTKLVLIFSCLSVGILLTVALTGYFFAQNRCTDSIEKEMNAVIDAHVNKLEGWLKVKQTAVEHAAAGLEALEEENQRQQLLLAKYKEQDADLSDVYVGGVDGNLISGINWKPLGDFDPRTRVWYVEAMKQKKTIFTEPYIDAQTKRLEVSMALPYQAGGRIKGVISADIFLKTLTDHVQAINIDGQGYAYLVDEQGVMLAHPNEELVAKKISETAALKDIAPIIKEGMVKGQGSKHYQENGKEMIMVYKKIPSTKWLLCITVEEAAAFQPLSYLRWMFVGMTIVSILVVIFVTFVVARRITNPIQILAKRVEALAAGNLTVQADIQGSDEIAKLAACFNKMVQDIRGMVHELSGATSDMLISSNKLVDISANLAANTQEMSATVSMVSASVEEISAGTQENASSTAEVSHNVDAVDLIAGAMSEAAQKALETSEMVAGEVNAVSAAIEEVSQSISKVAGFTKEVAKSCKRSIQIAAAAKQRSADTNQIIHKLNVSSKDINSIVGIIRTIAEQTNMLALNATIEAASAGEAGKGFAVVAGEVKELSRRTGEEAARIAQQIEDMQLDMSDAVAAVGSIDAVIAETMEITQKIAAAVSEQAYKADVNEEEYETTISTEVASIAQRSSDVAQNAVKMAGGVQELRNANADISAKAIKVAGSTSEMTSVMLNISQATAEIAKGTQNISESMQETDSAINDTANKASTVSECAYAVGESANRLKELISKFNV